MRVISGSLKGHPLKSVSGKGTRPTADKIKESVFQIIGPYFAGNNCLDLFAGTGAMGIEALSRGMEKCVFVDQSKSANTTIHANLQALDLTSRGEVCHTKAQNAINRMAQKLQSFDLIILDPPYKTIDYINMIGAIIHHNLLNINGLVYCEHDPEETLPGASETLSIMKQKQYGKTTAITIYQLLGKGE